MIAEWLELKTSPTLNVYDISHLITNLDICRKKFYLKKKKKMSQLPGTDLILGD